MKRSPSIHITNSKLYRVLKRVLAEEYSDKELKALVKAIMMESVKYSLTNRSINVNTKRDEKSTRGLVSTETEDIALFAHLLTLHRRKLNHRAIIIPRPGTKEWTFIQHIIPNVNSFCEDFNLSKKAGYSKYIEIGVKKMNLYRLTGFSTMHDLIADEYEAINELANDMTPARTERAHQVYSKHLGEMAIVKNYSKEPSKMVYFKRVAEKCSELKVTIEHYIAAQFDGLKWANTIPEPAQLVTEASMTRLNKYIVKANLKDEINNAGADELADKIQKQWSKL